MSILIFLGVLVVLILVHEWGHFITAKWTGMRVDEFGIGFPPKLLSWRRGETVYSLNVLPIGGFVKILGENGDVVADALPEADASRTFNARPKWAQAVVLVAGVTMNIILAWVIFVAILLMGTDVQVDSTTASAEARFVVLETIPDSPASVLPGKAEITAVTRGADTLTSYTPEAFKEFVTAGAGAPITVTYKFNEESVTKELVPKVGLNPDDPSAALLGVSTGLIEHKRFGIGEAVIEASMQTAHLMYAITVGLFTLLAQAVQGTADFSQVAGPVGIVEHVGVAASYGLVSLMYFTAIISLNLAVINLLPIPALDGGRLIFVAIEAITRRPINPVWAGRLNLLGFAALMLLMVVVTYNDILKLF